MVKISVLLFVVLLPLSAAGQDYGFSIPQFTCVVEVNTDRSLTINYDIVFECTPGRHSIDIIDIGFPSDDYLLSYISASVDGYELNDIYPSYYIEKGVEVHLGRYSILPGDSGRFRLTGTNTDMVFLDTEQDDYASVEFTPTWFDSGFLSGSSEFTLKMIFPEGASADSVRYHDRPYTGSSVNKNGQVVYTWAENRRVDSEYMVGVSFPDDLVEGPLTERPKEPLISSDALLGIGVFGFVFLIFGTIAFSIVKAVIKANRRREQYLPPKLGLEGSGIKRGLTAPMAALLLEEKLDRVFVLIVFGLLKKGVLELKDGRLHKTGIQTELRFYENKLMSFLPEKPTGKPISESKLREVFVEMIKVLDEKMEDFSLKETQEYYRSVIKSAWNMVSAEQSAQKAGEILGDRFQWLLADRKFQSRVNSFPEGTSAYFPGYFISNFSVASFKGGGSGGMNISQACHQVAGALTVAAQNTVSRLTRLSSTVTSKTNPVPVSTYRSSGGGSSCACACAGCACACAGGGR